MNPIEKTIRAALERGDASDRVYREKVYRSVFAALEKNIAANPDLTDEMVEQRREMLKASIRIVESEFIPAFAPEQAQEAEETDELPESTDAEEPMEELPDEEEPLPAPPPPVRRRAPQSSWTAASNRYYQDEQEVHPPRPATSRPVREAPRPAPAPTPRFDEPIPLPVIEPRQPRIGGRGRAGDPGFGELVARREAPMDRVRHRPVQPARGRGRSRIFVVLFLAVTLLAAGSMGIWWIVDQGLFRSAEDRDTSVPNPPLTLEDEEFQPEGRPPLSDQEAADNPGDDWITVFTPTDPTQVIMTSGGTAQVIDIEGGMALRIRSTSADEPVRFVVGEGILQRISGRRAVFNIRARTDPGKETQILVTCDFGPLGDCGRNRYFVSSENRDFAVGRDMPDARPTGAGAVTIVTDLDNGGRSVDIIEIRVAVQE